MKDILVPTDFSKCADYALEAAASLARRSSSRLHLAHYYHLSVGEDYSSEALALLSSSLEQEFNTQLEALAKRPYLKGIEVFTYCVPGLSIVRLLDLEVLPAVDLVVLGSHGASGFKEALLGSNAEKIIRHAACPVITVKQKTGSIDIKRVVFASNFLEEVYPAFESIKKILSQWSPELHLLKVITPRHFETSQYSYSILNDFIENAKPGQCEIQIMNDYEIETGISNYVAEVEADLLAIATHGTTGIGHLIHGSLTEDLANHLSVPVLSMHIPG